MFLYKDFVYYICIIYFTIMDILNFISWIRGGRKVNTVDPAKTLIPVGLKDGRRDDDYLAGAISVEDLAAQLAPTTTLQQILDNNHDLVDGNNFQGTNAGLGNTGTSVIAIGESAAQDNTGQIVVSVGDFSAYQNQGTFVAALGTNAARENTGIIVNAVGRLAAYQNTGDIVNAIGYSAAAGNAGNNVNAFGEGAAADNTGTNVNAVGNLAARQNTGNNVIALGTSAGIANPLSGMFIISNSELPSYADHAAAVAAISPTGIPNNTYIYHNQATMSIGAVRL